MFRFKKRDNIRGPEFFEYDPVEERFDSMMTLVKDLSRKDYNRLKEAMDLGYNAYQKVRNIDADNSPTANTPTDGGYILHPEEGK